MITGPNWHGLSLISVDCSFPLIYMFTFEGPQSESSSQRRYFDYYLVGRSNLSYLSFF